MFSQIFSVWDIYFFVLICLFSHIPTILNLIILHKYSWFIENVNSYIKLPDRNYRPIKNLFALNIKWYFYIIILRFYILIMSPMNNIVCRYITIEFRELLIFPLNDKKPI